MTKPLSPLDTLLALQTRSQLRAAIFGSGAAVTNPMVGRLVEHAADLEQPLVPFRLGVIHTYTSNLLDPWLTLAASVQGLALDVYHAPQGIALQEASAGSGLDTHDPDATLFMLQWGDLHPDLANPVAKYSPEDQATLKDEVLDRLSGMLRPFQSGNLGHLVLSFLPRMDPPALGLYDSHADSAEYVWWTGLKQAIAAQLRTLFPASSFLDLDTVVNNLGRQRFFDQRNWFSLQYPFSTDAALEFARLVTGFGAIAKFPKAKVIVLDADNTLWGGIVGEDGPNGIGLGPDYPGNAYVAFQRRILALQARGYILAMCSKNNLEDVQQILDTHPHQILQQDHFASLRVNWQSKPENLRSIAEELNLGLDSFIFVDDSDYECAAVRHALPEVEVIQVPSKPTDVPYCLDRVARLEILSLTAEDQSKTEMYAQERRRRELKGSLDSSGGGQRDYLRSLEMKMTITLDDPSSIARISQMTQKTNQFNLTTRRYDESEIQGFIRSEDWIVAHFSLADVFGDSGIVGLAILNLEDTQTARLDTFLMSCRVIGREAETAFLQSLMTRLEEKNITRLVAEYLPTQKNKLVENFLPNHGFTSESDATFARNIAVGEAGDDQAHSISIEFHDQWFAEPAATAVSG
jgi:FkbH-like protein